MNKRKLLAILTAVLLLASLLVGSVLAAHGGNGTSNDPYIVDSSSGTFSSAKIIGTYYVTLANLYSTNSDLYYSTLGAEITGSYAVVTVYDSYYISSYAYTVNSIVVSSDQYVYLSASLPGTSQINGGTLSLAASNYVTGNSASGSNLTVYPGSTANVSGSFASLSGDCVQQSTLNIYGGTASVTGSGYDLNVSGGTVSVSGGFNDFCVYAGAVANIAGNTYIDDGYNFAGTVNVNSDNTLCIGGRSVKSGGGLTFDDAHAWGYLPTGTYDSVVGNWTMLGDVTVKGTTCAIYNAHTGASLAVQDYNLTVAGGSITASGNVGALSVSGGAVTATGSTIGSVTVSGGSAAIGGTVSGAIDVSGGQVEIYSDTLADSVSISGTGSVKLDAAKALCDGSRSLEGTDASYLILSDWGTLPAGSYPANIVGDWTQPSDVGFCVVSTSCGCSISHTSHSGAHITGAGGALSIASNDVSVSGSFASLASTPGTSTVVFVVSDDTVVTTLFALNTNVNYSGIVQIASGATLCDDTKSICPAAAATITNWDTLTEPTPLPKSGILPGSGSYGHLSGNWHAGSDVTITSTGCSCGTHTHDTYANITGGDGDLFVTGGSVTLSGKVNGTVFVSGGTVTDNGGNSVVNVGGVVVGSATDSTHGTVLNAGSDYKLISGSFASVTGTNLNLAGDTVIYSTGASSAVISGNGFGLTVGAGSVSVQGSFSAVNTASDLHVTQIADASVGGGSFGLTGSGSYTLSVSGGTGHIAGTFKQIHVSGGSVADCGALTLANTGTCLIVSGGEAVLDDGGTIRSNSSSSVDAVQVTGGELTIGTGSGRTDSNIYKIFAASSNSSVGNKGINVSGGECWLLDGQIVVSGSSSNGVLVYGTDSKFHLGSETNTDAYSSLNNPTITAYSDRTSCVYVSEGGEAWLHAGELNFKDVGSFGVFVTNFSNSGICHVWANDQYGENAVGSAPLLYIHGGTSATAAMWVGSEGMFDIRGRGVLFEEPADYTSSQYALYISNEALAASDYPLSGGTYNGKVRYDKHNLSDLILYNHYLRYDGASANFGYTDGTYGVYPGVMTSDADSYGSVTAMHAANFAPALSVYSYDGAYGEYFGKAGEYYSIADAEWELREQMKVQSAGYQIPAGIVRSDTDLSNAITLDVNVFAQNNSEYTPYWGIEKKLGDVDVTGMCDLFFAGRTVRYDGYNWDDDALSGIVTSGNSGYAYSNSDDWKQVFDIHANSDLGLYDGVLGEGNGINPADDKAMGGYIGTGMVAYEWIDNSNQTRAIRVVGKLYVVSAQIKAVSSVCSVGVDVVSDEQTSGEVYIGIPELEDIDNQIIHILGGLKTGDESYGIYQESGYVEMNGGVIGDVSSQDFGGNTGIYNIGGTLNVYGGIIAGNTGSGKAVKSSAITTITGGCLYGDYLDDDANGGTNNGESLYVTGGTTYLKIDAAHSGNAYTTAGFTEDVIPLTGENAYKTESIHHINNVTIDGGELYVGSLTDYDLSYNQGQARDITGYTRNNGYLTCSGGKTVFYDGIVMGKTTVVGSSSISTANADFGTQFYADKGSFGDLAVVNGVTPTSSKYYQILGGTKLTGCVQLHGGSYKSIDVSGLTTGWSGVYPVNGASVNNILGFWTNTYDLNEDGTNDWVQYNHYAAVDTASRNAAGYWISTSVNPDDESRYVGGTSTVVPAGGKAVNVIDGASEFITWLESNATSYDSLNGEGYTLRCNIWLGNSVDNPDICNSYFHCGWRAPADMPVVVGGGSHTLVTNNFGIFGNQANALIKVGSDATSVLNITNTNSASTAAVYQNLIRNLLQNSFSRTIEVANGALTVSASSGNSNTVTLKAYDESVYVSGTGSVTLNAGTILGKGDSVISEGVYMTGSGSIVSTGGVITGQGAGIAANAGTINLSGTVVTGQNKCGIYSAGGNITLAGCTVSGNEDGIAFSGTGNITASTSTLIGSRDGISSIGTGNITLTDCAVTGGNDGIHSDGVGDLTVSGAVSGADNGIYFFNYGGKLTANAATGGFSSITGGGYDQGQDNHYGSDGISCGSSCASVTLAGTNVYGNHTGISVGNTYAYKIDSSACPISVSGTATQNATVTGFYGDGIFSCGGGITANYVTVTGSDDGIVMYDGTGNISVSNGSVTAYKGCGIDLGKSAVGNVTVTNADVAGYDAGIIMGGAGSVSVTGTEADPAEISGEDNDGIYVVDLGTGLSLSYAKVTGASDGIEYTGTGSFSMTNSSVTGYNDGVSVYAASELTVTNTTISGTNTGSGIYLCGEGAKLTLASGAVTGAADGIYVQSPATLSVSGGTITGNGGDGIDIDADSTLAITSGTISGTEDGVDIAGASTVSVSGSTATIQGGVYGMSQNSAGSSVAVKDKPVFTGNPYGFYKANVIATTSLRGGIYSGIITSADGEKLSNIVDATVKDSARATDRTTPSNCKTVTDFILENNQELTAREYNLDNGGTSKVTYSTYFLLYTSSSGGGGGGGVSYYDVTVSASGSGTATANKTSATSDVKITLTVTPADGCVLKSLTVTKKTSGSSVTVSGSGSTYTFLMPEDDVVVKAIFSGAEDPMDVFDEDYNDSLYKGFNDVDESAWYGTKQQGAIEKALNLGIMVGYGNGNFGPSDTLKLNEAIKISAVICSKYLSDGHVFDQTSGSNWWDCYVQYAIDKGIIKSGDFSDYTRAATRAEMAYIFANALPKEEFEVINALTYSNIPDVDGTGKYDEYVLLLYKAGVLTGIDEAGTFAGSRTITRAEVAAILSRVCLEEQRIAQ